VGQINPVFATLNFQGRVWDTMGQRDTGTKMETAAFSDGLFTFQFVRRNAIGVNTRQMFQDVYPGGKER
jgi:hypothetical protein